VPLKILKPLTLLLDLWSHCLGRNLPILFQKLEFIAK